VIYDASGTVTQAAGAGKLGVSNQEVFGMYKPELYTALALSPTDKGYLCVTCSGALSITEKQTLSFVFGMVAITVLSFTWFANGMLSLG